MAMCAVHHKCSSLPKSLHALLTNIIEAHIMHYLQCVQGEDCVLELHHATLQESKVSSLIREHKNDFSQSTSLVH